MRWTVPLKGFTGHPLHPPLTDVTIGALTVGTIAALLGWARVFTDVLAPTAVASLVIGLVFAIPTAVTGLVDLLGIRSDAPARTAALLHLGLMVLAVVGFFLAVLLLLPGLDAGGVPGPGAAAAAVALLMLTAGGWVGGSLAYVYGVRVLGTPDVPPGVALRPHGSDKDVQ